jgi:hypothetical protein
MTGTLILLLKQEVFWMSLFEESIAATRNGAPPIEARRLVVGHLKYFEA